LNNQRLESADIITLADLPPLDQLRSEILGTIEAPIAGLLGVIEAPAREIVGILQAWVDKQGQAAPAA
jgi:large subunit ribosomal protein L10